jgi:DNA transposition AAA+ family ATPase
VVPALEEVAFALGLREISGGAARLKRAIIARLRGTKGLMIVDEAQHLGTAALDELRTLHDATEVGLALVGNESVYARMTGGNRAAYLDRLFSRIGKRVRLVRSHKDDIDALIDAWGIDAKECRQVLHDIAAKPGALRGITKVLRLASRIAAGRRHKLSCEDIRAAWLDLGGEA